VRSGEAVDPSHVTHKLIDTSHSADMWVVIGAALKLAKTQDLDEQARPLP